MQGGKGNTIDAGTHVPLIISWPDKIKDRSVYKELVEFSDFFPTLAELTGKKLPSVGKSFYPLITGGKNKPRKTAFVYYDPQWGKKVNKYRNIFARTLDYKLYRDGKFHDLTNDILEKHPLTPDDLTEKEQSVKALLENELAKHPRMH